MDERLQQAVAMREAGELEAARRALLQLTQELPDDAAVHYQAAWAHDALDLEAEAAPLYERALALGLPDEDARGALLGLGSTYRNLGRHAEAERTLRAGRERFAPGREFDLFLALVLHDLGRHADALRLSLTVAAETSSDPHVRRFERALGHYADTLGAP